MLTFVSGLYEFVKKGDPPVMGITKMEPGVTLDEMKRPWVKLGADSIGSMPAATPTAGASV